MRILQVIHQFPPYSSQGSEVYCYNLCLALQQTEEVGIFHTSNVPSTWRRRFRREQAAGLTTYHCIDGAEYSRVAAWPNRFLRSCFQKALEDFRPDVVHFHNFVSLGDDLVTLARENGAAVVYTLHDYGLICPNALLLRDDGRLCGKASPDFFQDCCPVLIRADRPRTRAPWSARLPSLARWQLFAKQYPGRIGRTVLRGATRLAARWLGEPRQTDVEAKRGFFLAHTRQIFRDVDLFLAPSDFLKSRYVSCGIPAEKIAFARYGLHLFPPSNRKPPHRPVRFGYIGALHPQKGIELLLEAFDGFDDGASLHIFGSAFGSPISDSFWRRIRSQATTNVFFHGSYANERVPEILADVDMIVVPSIWYENSPLTIQEAFIAGVPVLTSDVGGMAELVHDGIDGLHFRRGDALDLRAKLRHVVDHPELLEDLRRGIRPVCSIEQHAADVLDRYREIRRSVLVERVPRVAGVRGETGSPRDVT